MAETVTPSVRGTQRTRVVLLLLVAGVATGAGSAALVAAVYAALGLPAASTTAAVVVAGVALVFDVVGRPRPFDVRRQVPQVWGRLFAPETVAVLYGARLGVGPLTILTSWLWWAAFAVAVTLGPLAAAAAGAAFHVARVATMLAVTAGAQTCMPARVAGVRARERAVARVAVVIAAMLALATAVTGCSSDDDAAPRPATAATPSATRTPPTPSTSPSAAPPTPETLTVHDLLPETTLPGFDRVPDGRRGAGPLDLDDAAGAERDAAAERSLLTTRGFERGLARVWTGPEDDTVYAAVYEFADAAGASAYLADGRETLQARRVREFPVEQGFGFTQVDETSQGAFVGHAVAFTAGHRYALVIVGGDGSRRTPDEARDVARRVWDGLAPSLPR